MPTANHKLDRIIVGNQIAIMRALALTAPEPHATILKSRVSVIKTWWRDQFKEEVGYESQLDREG